MPIFIGICGGSSSGKTTISDYLVKNIENSSQMCLDDYTKILKHDRYKDREDFIKHHNFDCPDAYNINLLVHHLKELNFGLGHHLLHKIHLSLHYLIEHRVKVE